MDVETKINFNLYIKSLGVNHQEEYIIKHRQKLLPDWAENPQTIIFIFFQCRCPLDGTNLAEEQLEKDRLLSKFNQLGFSFYSVCKTKNILAEIICPKEGFPQYSAKGREIFSVQQIIARHLPLFRTEENRCGLTHPLWGRAVYPCIMLSLAGKQQIKLIIENCLTTI